MKEEPQNSISGAAVKTARAGGFSLLEVLVVVAVIAVLAAVIMGGTKRSKAASLRVACQSNLRQLYLAWDLYLADNDDRFLKGKNMNIKYGGWKGDKEWLPRPLNTYLGLSDSLHSPEEAEVYHCPADNGGVPGYAFHEKVFIHMGTGYQMNLLLVGYPSIGVPDNEYRVLREKINTCIKGLKGSHVDNQWRVILMGDYCWVNRWLEGERDVKDWHGRAGHDNVVFCDGHVELLRVEKQVYINGKYTVLPDDGLYDEAHRVQGTEAVGE